VAGSVAAGSVAAGSVAAGSVAAGSSVAAGACVAGAAPPQAERIMLAKTSKLSKTNSLRIFFFSSQSYKRLTSFTCLLVWRKQLFLLGQPPPFKRNTWYEKPFCKSRQQL
jgi:hypothetical protein